MINIIYKLLERLGEILTSVAGCIAGMLIVLLNVFLDYIHGHEASIFIVLFVTILDCVWGISRAIKDNKYTTSALMRDSVAKLAVYGTLILAFIGFDKIGGMGSSVSVTIVCSLIILVEVWSVLGNILIVYPEFPVLKLLNKYLVGEIASKLNCDPSEVEDALKRK